MSALITNGDTTVPVSLKALRHALQVSDSLKIMTGERDALLALKKKYEELEVKDSALISSLDENIRLANKLIDNLEKQVANSERQTGNEKEINLNLQSIIKKKNRTIIKIIAASVTIITTLLLLRT